MNFDITAFDAKADSEVGRPMPVKNLDGKPLGFDLIVLGQYADAVEAYRDRQYETGTAEEEEAAKEGRPAKRTPQQLRDMGTDGAVARVTGWTGIDQPFSPELLRRALVRNPHWVSQIIGFSNALGNVTLPTSSASSDMPSTSSA